MNYAQFLSIGKSLETFLEKWTLKKYYIDQNIFHFKFNTLKTSLL